MQLQLGKRLQLLARILHTEHSALPYHQIWDCCCDHGLLGRYLLERNIGGRVNFVDQVEKIIDTLSPLLAAYPANRCQLFTVDAAQLVLTPNARHLVIIAGIGGEQATHIVRSLCTRNPAAAIDFLLCPNNSIFMLRDHLAAGNFSLLQERLIKERKWFYEAILVRYGSRASPVSQTGGFWEAGNQEHQAYLDRIRGYCRSLLMSEKAKEAQERIDLYHSIMQA
jgi:tRNA (adenine22-N1)-methyltransferase